jgi:hypothetical protein
MNTSTKGTTPVENVKGIEMVEMSIPKNYIEISQHHIPTKNSKDDLKPQTNQVLNVGSGNILRRQRLVIHIYIRFKLIIFLH